MKTVKTAQPTSSDDGPINFVAPRKWSELTQDQLRYVYWLLSKYNNSVVIRTYMFFRFTGIKVVRKNRHGWVCQHNGRQFLLHVLQVESMIEQFEYVNSYETMDVRLDDIQGFKAVDGLLHGVRFLDFLNIEKYYQLFLMTEDAKFLPYMAMFLYRDKDGSPAEDIQLTAAEAHGTFMWYSYVKHIMGRHFTHFFKKVPSNGKESFEAFDIVQSTNVQIRALTDGDVTKEQQIYDTDCWRALTELDFKAKESQELKERMNKK